ncbi:MAG: hypothetical protein LQ345_001516 [Seirophora villosa]|nr:MAG: hypothetical protein LQ345_001516 [Seirophora villosa]
MVCTLISLFAILMLGQYDQFLLFGDSLFQQSCNQDRGFAFAPALQDGRRMILFGANDACLPGSESGQHVPLEVYKNNLRRIIRHPSVQAQSPRLILVTPPPVNEYACEESDAAKGIVGTRRTAEHTMAYADACQRVGQDLGVPVIDLWDWCIRIAKYEPGHPLPGSKRVERNGYLDEVLADGLHLSPAGYRTLLELTMRHIQRVWPDQSPDALAFVYPSWPDAPKAETQDAGEP